MQKRKMAFGVALALAVGLFFAYGHWPEVALDPAVRADRVLVEKGERTLSLLSNGKLLKRYRVSLGAAPVGHKTRAGDERTPEGAYVLDFRNANSRFYRSIHVSYPNRADVAAAQQLGASPGGAIMIHGVMNGLGWIGRWHRFVNWTDGCIAVTDREMDEIWRAVPDGTPIEIRP